MAPPESVQLTVLMAPCSPETRKLSGWTDGWVLVIVVVIVIDESVFESRPLPQAASNPDVNVTSTSHHIFACFLNVESPESPACWDSRAWR